MSDQRAATVSAIIPARNEELNIARTIRSLAVQPEIHEIVVVDDQSQDRTPVVLAKLSRESAKLRTLRVQNVPAGWLGKPHALAEGAKLAKGDWLLFTDADTEHSAGSLSALLHRAENAGADLLSISPGQVLRTWWEKAVIPVVYAELADLYRFEEVSDAHSSVAAANGQYILIRRGTYHSIGGHEAVRDAILEDVELARRVKMAGGKILFLPGSEWVQTRMYRTFPEMWHGWTKNLFLLYGRDSRKIMMALIHQMFVLCLPVALLLACSVMILLGDTKDWLWIVWLASATVFSTGQWAYRKRLRRLGWGGGFANSVFLGAPLFSLILINSWRAYRLSGLVNWKGRTYSVKGMR